MFSRSRIDPNELLYSDRDEDSYSLQDSQLLFASQSSQSALPDTAADSQSSYPQQQQIRQIPAMCGSDYWSQSSSLANDTNEEVIKSRACKNFSTKKAAPVGIPHVQKGRIKTSYRDLLNNCESKSTEANQRRLLDVFIDLLKEHCNEVKGLVQNVRQDVTADMASQKQEILEIVKSAQKFTEAGNEKVIGALTQLIEKWSQQQESSDSLQKKISIIEDQKSTIKCLEMKLKGADEHETALRESEQRLSNTLQESHDAILSSVGPSFDELKTSDRNLANWMQEIISSMNTIKEQYNEIARERSQPQPAQEPRQPHQHHRTSPAIARHGNLPMEANIVGAKPQYSTLYNKSGQSHLTGVEKKAHTKGKVTTKSSLDLFDMLQSNGRASPLPPPTAARVRGAPCRLQITQADSDDSDVSSSKSWLKLDEGRYHERCPSAEATNERTIIQTRITSYGKVKKFAQQNVQSISLPKASSPFFLKKTTTTSIQASKDTKRRRSLATQRQKYAERIFEFEDESEMKHVTATLRRKQQQRDRRRRPK